MNKMMKTVLCALCLVLGAWGALAATKTVTWTLPCDWEGRLELDQICEPVGAPSVAYYNALIEVPSTATNFVITTSDVAYRASELGRPAPVLEPSVIGEPLNAPVEDAALYAGVYPSDVFEKGEPWEMNGKTVLPVRIKVYRWNGPENKVEALSSLKLSIACESPRATLKLTTSSTAGAEDYLILSPSQFVTYWEEFAEYRRGTHPKMTFRVVNVNTEIYANSSYTGDDALKIHQYLEAKYAQGTRYVLLGAGCSKGSYDNTKMIPARYAWVKGASMVCDYYYCVMTKIGQRVWDYDADGVYLANASKQADANWKFSWKGDMKVHRFPARDSVSYAGKTCSAYDQIHGYVNKLKRAEALNFAGRFSNAPLGDQFSDGTDTTQAKSTSNTSVTMEREFFDLGTNLWAPDHGAAIAEQEPRTRDRVYTHMTLQRPVGWNSGVWQCHYQKDTIGTIHNRDYDILLINAHGSTEGSTPLTVADCWKSTGLKRFYIMCVPCHSGNIDYKNNNTGVPICLAEAPVLNPNGGALVSFSNVGYGIYGGRDAYNEKIERDILVALCGTDGKGYRNAGEARLYAQNNYGTPAASGGGGLVMADSMALGDPLVALTPFWSRNVDSTGAWRRGDQDFVSDQDFASTLTVNAGSANTTTVISNAIGAAYLNVNGTAGNTVTLDSSANGKFKVTNKVTVNDGVTLNWQVYGGFGRNGISFTNGGNLRLYAGGYYGSDFSGINKLTVAPPSGQKAVVDFDSKNYFRDASGKIGAIEITGAGETVIRSRQAGIFSTNLTIPVTGGGTVTLQTPTVGGNATYASSTKPLFDVQNSSLAIECNPILSNENFTRPLKFTNSNLVNKYEKFCFGHTAGSGFDFTISGDNNTISGMQPVKLNGELRIWASSTGKLNVTATLSNGSITGSLRIKSGATVRLAGVNTFTGGIVVESGARLIVADKSALGSGALTVKAGGVLEVETMPLNNVRQITIENTAKLVVHGQGQLFNPNVTTWKAGSGMEIYSSEGGVETKVDAVITTEGAFFNPAAALTWREGCGLNWVNNSSVLAWTKNGVNTGFTNGEGVYIKDSTTGAAKITIPVSGAINPSIITFNNGTTPVEFTSANSASITSDAISTMGETTFNPPVTANSRFTAGGKTTVSTLTTKTVNVPSGGALNVTGSVNGGAETITIIRFNCTDIMRWDHCTVGESEKPMEISEFRCFTDTAGNTLQFFPVGTVITDNAGRSVKITGMSSSGTAYVFGEESGGTTLKNLFDGNLSTVHAVAMGTKGPWTITVTMPTPIPMIKSFRFGTGNKYTSSKQYYAWVVGNYPCGNPYVWSLSVGNSVDKLTSVLSRTENNTSANTMTGAYSVTQLPSTSSATVQNGGSLYLNGTYNIPVTVNSGATLAITNTSKATFSSSKSWPSGTFALNIDAKDAKKQSTWFQVTSGAGLTASDWLFKTDDDTAAEVRSGELWVATAGVMAPPYSRTITGENTTVNWNTTDWYNGKNTQFTSAWGSSITKPTGMATLNVTGTNLTMNINCAVKLDTLKVTTPTNCYPQSLIVNLASGNTTAISAIDFREFNGRVTWNPTLASWGTNIYVGTNDVTIANMTSGMGLLQIGENGKATFPAKFSSYDIADTSHIRVTGTHNFSVDNDLPNKGIQSFDNTTLSGGFQKSAITYLVENNDVLNFTGASGNNYGRINSSFDIRGGSVTINSNGATTWFGHNGTTTFKQTGGTFKCTANGTGTSGTGNGLLLGYDSSKTMDLAMDIFGGSFLLPNTSINFFGSTVFTVTNSAVLQAKGVYMSGSNKGTINVYDNATFELGTIGLVAGACDFNLYGGTLAGFENDAHTRSTVNLVGVGTLAAKANTTFTIDPETINTDGATLNIGNANYTGTVKLSEIPTGVTNITVTAGTWDMGELRPTNSILSRLDGKIAVELDDDELRQAANGGLTLFKTTLETSQVSDKLKVITATGSEVTAIGRVDNGKLVLAVDYVYPLYATTVEDAEWSDLYWHDSIGMPFNGDWSKVTDAVLTNELNDVVLTVTNAFSQSLTIVNSGTLVVSNDVTIKSIDTYNSNRLTIAGLGGVKALRDGKSTGETIVDAAVSSALGAGLNTVIKRVGTGTLSVNADHKVTFNTNLNWTATTSYASGAKVRFLGERNLNTPLITTTGVITSYENATVTSEKNVYPVYAADDGDNWTLNSNGGNGITAPIKVTGGTLIFGSTSGATPGAIYYGGISPGSGISHSVITVTGGKLVVNAHGTGTSGNGNGLLLGTTATTSAEPSVNVSGGSFEIPNSSINFWENSSLTVSGSGLVKVKGIFKGNANYQRTGTINLNGGELSIGSLGMVENSDDSLVLNLAGGKLSCWESATVNSEVAVNSSNTSRLSADDGKTLTIAATIAGSGAILCEPVGTGKVVLKGGVNSNVTLGGTFTLYLTDEQKGATINVNLFKPATDFDASKVTLVDSTGTKVDGEICVYGGYVTYVPPTGFKMPIVGELYTNSLTSTTYWHDSSDTPRTYSSANLASASEIILNVHSNVTFGCNYTATYPSFRIRGPGQLTLLKNPSVHTFTKCYIETDVISTNDAVVFTAVDIAENASLTVPVAKAPGSISGKGTLVSNGATLPTSSGLTDATKWQGTVKLTGTLDKGLDLGSIGNASSTVEFAGQLKDATTDAYLTIPTTVNSAFVLSGKMKIQNGNSETVHAKFCGKFSGDGTFETAGTAPYKKDIFQITGDASGFAGTITLGCVYHDVAFGTQTYGTGGTIFIGNDKGATIVDGKQWTAPTEIKVQNGGTLNIRARTGETYASPSKVTVVSGGYLNLLQTSEDQLVWRITSNTTFTLPAGCLKVNGKAMASDQYSVSGGVITLKACTLTWNGGATGGTWNKSSDNWLNGSSSTVAWFDGFKPGNTAKFNGDTSLTLGETVSPDVLDIRAVRTAVRDGFVPTSSTVLFQNMKLSDVTAINGEMSGGYVTAKGPATPYFYSNNGSTATVQLQIRDGTSEIYLKSCKITLTQSGNDIAGMVTFTKFLKDGALGTDLTSQGNTQTTATSDTADGYGIKNISLTYNDPAGGNLTVANAQNFGKAFTVANGILSVVAGTLTQDVALGPSGKLNIISTEIATEYVATKGKVIGGTMENLLFNGSPLESGSWTLDLENGKLKRVVKPGTTPFTYTIAENGTTQWTNAPWVANNWFYVRPEEWVTNTVAEADLTVEGGITNTLVANANMTITTLKVLNSGMLTISNEVGKALVVTTLDDSASSGKTTLNFAPTNVKAGSDTIINAIGSGTLTIDPGMKATVMNGTWGTVNFSGTAELCYAGTTALASLPFGDDTDYSAKGVVSYAMPVSGTGDIAFRGNVTRKFMPGFSVSSSRFVTGNGSDVTQSFTQEGGDIVVTGTGSIGGSSPTTTSPVLFAHWPSDITYVMRGGTFTAINGSDGSVHFGRDGRIDLTIGGGESVAKMKVNGIATSQEPKGGRAASKLTLQQNGVLEIGSYGISFTHGTTSIVLNGGTLRGYDNATVTVAGGLSLASPATLTAEANKTLTVASAISGTSGLTIGENTDTGTVKLSGDLSGFTGDVAIFHGTLEVPTGALKGNVTIGADGTLNVTGTAGGTEYAITDGNILLGDGATMANIKLNGQALPADEKWEIEGGKIKRRIITPPFKFIITQNGNWNDQTWYDSHDIVLRDYEVAYYSTNRPSITLDVQNESSLFITNILDLTSLTVSGSPITLDFGGIDASAWMSGATYLHPTTNTFFRGTILGNRTIVPPALTTGYTGQVVETATGLDYVIIGPRVGHDYVATIDLEGEIGSRDFSAIEWDCVFTNNEENTVTIRLDGYLDLTVNQSLDLMLFKVEALNQEYPGSLYFVTNSITSETLATNLANVKSFNFAGVDTVATPIDLGDRVTELPVWCLDCNFQYAGELKDRHSFNGSGNSIVGGNFAGANVSLTGSGTLSGNFVIAAGGSVYFGGDYAGADSSFDIGTGLLSVYNGRVSLKTITGGGELSVIGGDLTVNVAGYSGTITVGDDDYAGILDLSGVAAGPVNVSTNGSLYLTRATQHQTEFPVTTGTLTFPTEAKLYINNELIESSRITVEGGTITVADNVPTEPFTFTIATSGTYDWTDLAWRGANGVLVTPEYWEDTVGNVQLSSANGVTATVNVDTNLNITAFELTGNTTLNVTTGDKLGTIAGTGTIVCNFWPEGDNAVGTLGEDWTGTFKVNANTDSKINWDMTSYYNGTSSTFQFAGTVSAGYFNKTNTVEYGAINLTGSITFDNGYSHLGDPAAPCNYIYTKLSGNGTFDFNKSGVTPVVWFKDINTFTGSLKTLASSYRLVVGDGEMTSDSSYPTKGGLTVVGDTELAVNAKIIAPSGVLVTNATLTVNWGDNLKDSGTITVGGSAKLVVHNNTLSNNVTIATGGTLDLQITFTESSNEFKITEGTLTNNGTILVNGKAIPNGWAVVGNKLVKQGLIFWIAQGNANWNDPGVWAYQDGTLATFQEGDVVNFTNAVASVTLTANVAPSVINVASGANVTVNGNFTLGTPAITGAGTLAVNPGIGKDNTDLIPASCFTSFTGTYHLMSGRVKMTAAIASAVTLKVTDGGQLWLSGGTWNNPFELSGQGRKSGYNDVEYAALRVEGNQLGTSSSIVFVEEDGYITPGIGSTNGYTVPSVLSGCGMMVRGSGEMYLSVPKTQAAGINGPVIINGCTVKFGDSYENDWNTQYKLGTSVEVKSGATLRLKLCQHGGTGVDDSEKSHFVTPVILNGGTLYDYDGSYCYDSVEVRADSTFRAGDWGKRQIFKSLSGTGRLTVTSHQDTIFGILGGTFTGSIYNNGNGKVTPRNNALANATLELTSGGQLSLIDATQTIGKLMGGGSVYANQNATLTLKGGSYTGVIQNTSGGVGSTKLGLTIDGDVVLSGANTYTGLTTINEGAILSCVAASGTTVTFPGGIAGTGTLIAEGAGMVNLAGYRLTNDEWLMLANAGKIGFTLTAAETNGTAWVSFAKMLDDNVGNIALYNPDGSANETFLLPKSINGVLMAKVKSNMPAPKYGYAFDGNLNAETGCTALSFGGESGDHYEASGHGQAYKFASGYTPYGANFAKPTGEGWTIATFAKPVATDHRVFWTLGDANDLFGLAVAPNRCVKVFKAAENTAHTTLLTSDPIDDFSLEYHLFVMTYDGTTLKLYVDGVVQGDGYTGTVSFPNNQKFQFGSIHGGAGNTGVSRGDDILLDEWRVYSEVLTDEQLVTLTDEFKPWRANAVEKGSVLFIASSNDWDPTKLPTTAGKATATSNISFANNSSYLRQLADGFDTVALVTDATAGTYIYGLHAINGSTGLGAITRNVYLAMNAGTAYLISGGEDAQWNGAKTIPTGNLLTQLGGSAVVDYAFGAGHKGGGSGTAADVKGDTGVTITDDAQVRGTVAGGWSSIHQAQPKVSGNTSVLVRNIQRYSAASTRLNDITDNYLIGGSVFIGNGGGGVITGNTSVTVDIDDSQSGTFVKNIIGGSWYNNSHDMTIGGSSSVYVSAPKTVSFTGTFYAGSYGDSAHSTVAGTATMTLKNANFNAATLKGGNATGAKSLTAYFDEDAIFTPKTIDGFGTVKVGAKKGATVTLGTVFANQALTLESGNFELKSASPITLSSLAFTDSPTLTIAPNKTDAAIKVTTGSVDLNGTTISLDPLYFRDIPEDDTSTYVLMSAPTIVTNGVSLGKGTWTLALENVDDKQVLKATRGKGFYFIIAKNELTEETYVEHDTDNTKQSISVDTKWLVAKTDLTEEDVKDVETVSETLNEEGENGAKIYESYVLGLDPNDATSKPVVAPVQTADPEKVTFKVANVSINKSSGANNVTYKVYSSTELGGEKTLETTTPVKVNEAVGIALPENGVRYYQIEVNVTPNL